MVEGGQGAGDQEKRGPEVYGRWEKRGREAGFPRWREERERVEKLCNNVQSFVVEKAQRGYRSQQIKAMVNVRFKPVSSPPPPPSH